MSLRQTVFITILLHIFLTANAIPVKRPFLTITQPDGYTFEAIAKGDEFLHIIKTLDGHVISKDTDGYFCYSYYDANGSLVSSGIPVGSHAPAEVLNASRNIPYGLLNEKAAAKKAIGANETPLIRRIMDRSPATRAEGKHKKHGLIILVQYKDVKFTYTRDDFHNMLTQEGYSSNGATGSALDYFHSQFGDNWEFSFDISEIVTLQENCAYYGGNDNGNKDSRASQMIKEACELADAHINFADYDDDGDGTVDNVFIFFAGKDEADDPAANADCIWSHAWYLKRGAQIHLSLDGKIIDSYACTAELSRTGKAYTMAGIGTFCHEYSHTFGLPDFYDTDYEGESGIKSAALWTITSLMDGGNQNNNGNTPPNYNAIEREILGIAEPQFLTSGRHSLQPVDQSGKCYRLDTDTEGEYYLIECRSSKGWDAYIGGGGMLIYHIDKSTSRTIYSDLEAVATTPYERWKRSNEVNANPDHQCADLIEADGREDKLDEIKYRQYFYNYLVHGVTADFNGLFFPAGNTGFKAPAFSWWSGQLSPYSISDIAIDGDNVTFNVEIDNTVIPTAGNISIEVFQDAAILNWKSSIPSSGTAHIRYGTGSDRKELAVEPYKEGLYAIVLEGLAPGTAYSAEIYYTDAENAPGSKQTRTFTTLRKTKSRNVYPYIYLKNVERNPDGSFRTGTRLPLRVFNATDAVSIEWTLDGRPVSIGKDGYYHIERQGILKAAVNYSDGSTDIITKSISIKD